MKLYMQKPKATGGLTSFLEQFSFIIWILILVFLVAFMLTILLIAKFGQNLNDSSFSYRAVLSLRIFLNMGKFGIIKYSHHRKHYLRSIQNVCYHSVGYDAEEPTTLSYRTLVIFFLFFASIIHVSYSSSLITKLSTRKVEMPFEDIAGLLKMKDYYSFGTVADSTAVSIISVKNSSSNYLYLE